MEKHDCIRGRERVTAEGGVRNVLNEAKYLHTNVQKMMRNGCDEKHIDEVA